MTALLVSLWLATAIVAPEFLVVPGKSVGPIQLGFTRAQVRERWGEPASFWTQPAQRIAGTHKLQPSFDADCWSDAPDEYYGRCVYYVRGRVRQMQVESSRYSLPSGLRSTTPLLTWMQSFSSHLEQAFYSGSAQGNHHLLVMIAAQGVALDFVPDESDPVLQLCRSAATARVVVFPVRQPVLVEWNLRKSIDVEEDLSALDACPNPSR